PVVGPAVADDRCCRRGPFRRLFAGWARGAVGSPHAQALGCGVRPTAADLRGPLVVPQFRHVLTRRTYGAVRRGRRAIYAEAMGGVVGSAVADVHRTLRQYRFRRILARRKNGTL